MGDRDRVLILTNDDGIEAPGLRALFEAVEDLGRRMVIAPAGPQSGCGHAVTTRGAVRSSTREPGWIAVSGTPADCVRLALHHLEPDSAAAWVISGINPGGNLGADIYISGTVAAAREAVLHGRPAIAVSQYIARGRPVDWSLASRRAARVIADLVARPREPGTLWNVNLPHPEPGAPEPAPVDCPIDPSPLPLSYRRDGDDSHYDGDYHERTRRPGSDVDVCFGGRIAVTKIRLLPP